MNIGDILLGALILTVLLLALGHMSKHGTGGCGGDCSSCGVSASCHDKDNKNK